MRFNLNDKLDISALAAAYGNKGYIQIKDILLPSQAEELHTCLAKDTPWGLFYFRDGQEERIPPEDFEKLAIDKKQEIFQYIFQTASHDYQFMFFYYPIMKSVQAKVNPGFTLHQWLAFLNTEPVLEFVRTVTGIPDIIRADAVATKFTGNGFLHCRRDHQEGKTRRVAYVMNLTKGWKPDWGGYLQVFDDNLNVEHAFKPAFNCLNMFTVPRDHSVSTVPPFVLAERLSLTGWFHAA